MSNERSMRRERALAEMSSKPLMKGAVYHSAKFGPSNKQNEVCDILLLHRKQAIVISVKKPRCQEKQSEDRAMDQQERQARDRSTAGCMQNDKDKFILV
jgi:hypothetical protein